MRAAVEALHGGADPARPAVVSGFGYTPLRFMLVAGAAGLMAILAGDWIAGAALLVLWGIWRYLCGDGGPPVIALALSFQWTQVVAAVYYSALTGREIREMHYCDCRPMVLIGLGCIIALGFGLWLGMRQLRGRERKTAAGAVAVLSTGTLVWSYAASVVLYGIVRELAWRMPGFTQAILGLSLIRFALLFLIFCRLCRPPFRWWWFAALLLFEMVLGFTGYFAGFREPLMMAALAALEAALARREAKCWAFVALLAGASILSGVVWLGIRQPYRAQFEADVLFAESRAARFEKLTTLSSDWLSRDPDAFAQDVDRLVARLWAVPYPALAVSRIPSVVPHEDGKILWGAVRHVLTPRLFFPEKEEMPWDSDRVREYAGVSVAGREEGVSIAFGYAAESYVDFGVPWMFVPILVYGFAMGLAYRCFLLVIRHRDLAIALVSVVFWISLYLFERNWFMVLGGSGTLIIYLGGLGFVVDRLLTWSRRRADSATVSAPGRPRRPGTEPRLSPPASGLV